MSLKSSDEPRARITAHLPASASGNRGLRADARQAAARRCTQGDSTLVRWCAGALAGTGRGTQRPRRESSVCLSACRWRYSSSDQRRAAVTSIAHPCAWPNHSIPL